MEKYYKIELSEDDLGQLLDGMEMLAESWRRTADYLRTGDVPDGEFFLIDDCSDKEEADWLDTRYHAVIKNIQSQMKEQP